MVQELVPRRVSHPLLHRDHIVIELEDHAAARTEEQGRQVHDRLVCRQPFALRVLEIHHDGDGEEDDLEYREGDDALQAPSHVRREGFGHGVEPGVLLRVRTEVLREED